MGEDEADIKQGKVSVTSPVARALIGRSAGDVAEDVAPLRGAVGREFEHEVLFHLVRTQLAAQQAGDIKGAQAQWQALMADLPANAPLRSELVDRLASLGAPTARVAGAGGAQDGAAEGGAGAGDGAGAATARRRRLPRCGTRSVGSGTRCRS